MMVSKSLPRAPLGVQQSNNKPFLPEHELSRDKRGCVIWRPTRNGGPLLVAETRSENRCLYFTTRENWRLSQLWSNLLLQNGHEVSVEECAVLLFLAAEQLRQWRIAGSFFSTTQEFS
jgi:hypothetical protein